MQPSGQATGRQVGAGTAFSLRLAAQTCADTFGAGAAGAGNRTTRRTSRLPAQDPNVLIK
jgi:hypothetical protein